MRLVEVNYYWHCITVSVTITGSTARLFGTSWANADTRYHTPAPWKERGVC